MQKWLFPLMIFSVIGLTVLLSFTEKNITTVIPVADTVQYPDETHFKNIQQLTFGGDNAEAYFSFDGQWLIFQKTYANPPHETKHEQY